MCGSEIWKWLSWAVLSQVLPQIAVMMSAWPADT